MRSDAEIDAAVKAWLESASDYTRLRSSISAALDAADTVRGAAPFRFSDRLDSLASLQDGWDGYKGKAPTDKALATAANLCVVPTSCGGVQIEMHAGGANVEIEIGADGDVHGVYWQRVE